MGAEQTLFSRDLFFRSKGDNSRTCSLRIGDGVCLDSNYDPFPMCYAIGLTLEECQKAANAINDAIGFSQGQYVERTGETIMECGVLFDALNKDFKCPDGTNVRWGRFVLEEYIGTGPVNAIDLDPEYDCYSCASAYTPAPALTRTCVKRGDGYCTDSAQKEYPHCRVGFSKAMCKIKAAQNSKVIGYNYFDDECYLLFDAQKTYSCPDGSEPDESDPPSAGTGAISNVLDAPDVECYACADNEKQ